MDAGDVVDADHPEVVALGATLRATNPEVSDFARAAFEWVRDRIGHSFDVQDPRVTVSASQTLHEGVGLCYAKAHLLAAVFRSQGVPAGLCYQRLADAVAGHVVRGLMAVHLGGAWHRLDPRGNKPGVNAQFSLGHEQLAFTVDPSAGEVYYARLAVDPAPAVLVALRGADNVLSLQLGGLPSELVGF